MVGVYFSGTGNTEHCVRRFVKGIDQSAELFRIEDREAVGAIEGAREIVVGYPVYYSNLPKIVRDFIVENRALWKGKKVFAIATMGLFSGDGTGCSARLFKKYGAVVVGGLHLKMPDCIGDVKLLKKTLVENRRTVEKANGKIDRAVAEIKGGKFPREGLNVFCRLAGLFGQRLYFRGKTKRYRAAAKADPEKCVGCGLCVSLCPMSNISAENGKASFGDRCTMCYRCFSRCPERAVTVLGKKVYEQCNFGRYHTPNGD